MPMYIFYPGHADGFSNSFEAFELADDAAARAKAEAVLENHLSAHQVVVWRDGEALEALRTTRRRAPREREGEAVRRFG
jgi:hypothetical protein